MGHRFLEDVQYGPHPCHVLDAWVRGVRAPVLLHIHGGGFHYGAKSGSESPYDFLRPDWIYGRALAAGMAIVSMEYRLTGTHPFPAQAEDVGLAIDFLRSKAGEWSLDVDRITTCGESAGGHLGVCAGYGGWCAPPAAVVALHAPFDMSRFDMAHIAEHDPFNRTCLTALVACTPEEYDVTEPSKTAVRAASPIHLLDDQGPPILLVYFAGDGRPKGPIPEHINDPHSVWHGVQCHEAATVAGTDHEFVVLTKDEWSLEADAVLGFLEGRGFV